VVAIPAAAVVDAEGGKIAVSQEIGKGSFQCQPKPIKIWAAAMRPFNLGSLGRSDAALFYLLVVRTTSV
jgi:hypothetical protein